MTRLTFAVVVAFFALTACSSEEQSLPVSPITYGDSGYLPAKSDAAGLVNEPCRSQEALEEEGDWPLERVGTLVIASPSPNTLDETENGVEFVDGTVVEDDSGEALVFKSASRGGSIFILFEEGCYSEYDAMGG